MNTQNKSSVFYPYIFLVDILALFWGKHVMVEDLHIAICTKRLKLIAEKDGKDEILLKSFPAKKEKENTIEGNQCIVGVYTNLKETRKGIFKISFTGKQHLLCTGLDRLISYIDDDEEIKKRLKLCIDESSKIFPGYKEVYKEVLKNKLISIADRI